ncbi:MAG: glycosyl transferase [Mediterranea sp.]|jgi:hypothetical protein|nr:glycosyl transferase [Mediterranea sp.]
MNNCITFVPVGGLGNRMGAIASAATLAVATKSDLQIVWFQDWALHAPFHSLFQPVDETLCKIREATPLDYILLDRPRRFNLQLPRFYQKLRYSSCLYESSVGILRKEHFDFATWIRNNKRVYLASYSAFVHYDPRMICRLFLPREDLLKQIDQRASRFPALTIGVHIRRTDSVISIQRSPIEAFYQKLDNDINENGELGIYLATDSEEVKLLMKRRYGARIMTADSDSDRSSIAGMQAGTIELYTLARTSRIYGSFGSTFSEMAAQIGQLPIEVITRQ